MSSASASIVDTIVSGVGTGLRGGARVGGEGATEDAGVAGAVDGAAGAGAARTLRDAPTEPGGRASFMLREFRWSCDVPGVGSGRGCPASLSAGCAACVALMLRSSSRASGADGAASGSPTSCGVGSWLCMASRLPGRRARSVIGAAGASDEGASRGSGRICLRSELERRATEELRRSKRFAATTASPFSPSAASRGGDNDARGVGMLESASC